MYRLLKVWGVLAFMVWGLALNVWAAEAPAGGAPASTTAPTASKAKTTKTAKAKPLKPAKATKSKKNSHAAPSASPTRKP